NSSFRNGSDLVISARFVWLNSTDLCGRACSFLEGLSPSEPPDFHWRTASRHHHQPTGDSLSPRRRSGERVRERGFKRARQFDGTSPSPRSCLAGRGSRRLQRWWVYQDAPACPHRRDFASLHHISLASSLIASEAAPVYKLMESLPTVLLRPGEADRVVAGHPWIYQGSILRLTQPARDGDLV